MLTLLGQNLERARAAWATLVSHSSLRERLALVILAITVFVTAWGTMKVDSNCPEARPVAIAYWSVIVIVVAAKGANLTPSSDGSWIVRVVQGLTAWSTVSWSRLGVASASSVLICSLAFVGLFRALPQVQVAEDVTPSPDCSVGWALVVVPCAELPRRVWAPLGDVSLFLGEQVVSCAKRDADHYLCTSQVLSAETSQVSKAAVLAPSVRREPLLVYLQRSKDLSYEHAILDGFRARLTELLGERYEIKFSEAGGTDASYWNSKEVWAAKAQEIVSGDHPPNVVVTVGSDASSAMIDNKVPEKLAERQGLGFKGIFILGVSDPMRAGYARQSSKTAVRLRAVVRYGRGANDWAGTILRVFDTARLPHRPEFIYDNVQKQDSWVAEDLASSPLNNTDVEIIGPIQRALKVEDLEPGHVYFAWYALDTLVDKYPNLLADYLIVPSTYNKQNVRNFGVVVSVDDPDVGASGADLLIQALKGVAPEDLDIGTPPFKIWINCAAVERKKIPISPTLRRAEVVFVEDEDGQVPRSDCIPG